MTLHRLHLTTRKAGRNRRSMLEHLLRMEEEVLKEEIILEVDQEKEKTKAIIQKYKTKNALHHSFTYETIQEYLLTKTEQKIEQEDTDKQLLGIYTGELVEQLEGDSPLVIDLQGKTFHHLLCCINTKRHITIQNTNGDDIGAYAGSHHGTANIHFKNIKGQWTGISIGSYQGHATATFQDIEGHETGIWAGYKGNSTIVAHNVIGEDLFYLQEGKLVFKNTDKIKIEGIHDSETRRQIQALIEQNASPQQILNYIEANK